MVRITEMGQGVNTLHLVLNFTQSVKTESYIENPLKSTTTISDSV